MNKDRDHEEQRLDAVDQLTSLLESQEQAFGALQATRVMTLAAMFEVSGVQGQRVGEDAEMLLRSVAAEAASVIRMSDRVMQRRLWESWELVHRFPATFASLATGKLSLSHASAVQRAGINLDDEHRAEYESRAVPIAEAESVSRLPKLLGAVAEQIQPVGMTERHRHARKARTVYVRELDDGMGELVAILPAVLAKGCMDRLTSIAHAVQHAPAAPCAGAAGSAGSAGSAGAVGIPGAANAASFGAAGDLFSEPPVIADDRTIDQVRADVFADLLLAGTDLAHGDPLGAIRAQVHVTIPVHTLARVTESGATMAGWGPVDPDSVRTLAGAAKRWDRVMTDHITGTVVAVDRYRPSEAILRTLRVRDEHCRFPGCGQPTWRCDVDHTHDAAWGGETSIDNLAHLCRRHHTLKHASAWKVKQLGGGLLEWKSPTGRIYIDTPIRTVAFADAAATDAAAPDGHEPKPETSRTNPKSKPPSKRRGTQPPPLGDDPPW